MTTRVLSINGTYPAVWANPTTLHIGFDPPRVIVNEVSDDLLVLIHQLTRGISWTGLQMFAEDSGVSSSRLAELLQILTPVLSASPEVTRPGFIVDAPQDLGTIAGRALVSIGHAIIDPQAQELHGESPDVLIFAHYVPHPTQFHHWLRRDQPHTPVIFTDQAITVGPRILPGSTPCLHCALTEDEQSPWSSVAILSQLSGRPAPTATAANITMASWHAATMAESNGDSHQLRIIPGDPAIQSTPVPTTGGCGCLGLA